MCGGSGALPAPRNENKSLKFAPRDSEKHDEEGVKPVTVQRFEGWVIKGLDSRLRATESGTTMGEPVHGRGLGKRSLGMP